MGSTQARSPRHPASERSESRLLSPEEYSHSIVKHACRSIISSSFAGNNYNGLAEWLLRQDATSREYLSQPDKHHLAVWHDLSDNNHKRTHCIPCDGLTSLSSLPQPAPGRGSMLFLRGHLTPEWIIEVGSRFGIDPEFFCRHLDFFDTSLHRAFFSAPSLASTTSNIIHIYISTICADNMAALNVYYGSVAHRAKIRDEMQRYRKQLQRSIPCGASIVRDYAVLNSHYSVIEQRVSVCIANHGDGWIGIVWMDHGKDLTTSPSGPWFQDVQHGRVVALPVTQHHHKMTTRNITEVNLDRPPEGDSAPMNTYCRDTTIFPQSTLKVPMEYSSILSVSNLRRRAAQDPLQALIPVYAHAAFSEVAFLNLITTLIDEITAPAPLRTFQEESFEALQHYELLLQQHAERLRCSIRAIVFLYHRQGSNSLASRHGRTESFGPSLSPPPMASPGSSSAAAAERDPSPHSGDGFPSTSPLSSFSSLGILKDHEELLERCLRQLARVESAKTSEMTRAQILESRRAIEQSEQMKQLTRLATGFLPLTFAASLFGMNFNIFGQGELPVWWYLVIAIPLMLVTFCLSSSWNVWAPVTKARAMWLKRTAEHPLSRFIPEPDEELL